jgi:hypothetical protein
VLTAAAAKTLPRVPTYRRHHHANADPETKTLMVKRRKLQALTRANNSADTRAKIKTLKAPINVGVKRARAAATKKMAADVEAAAGSDELYRILAAICPPRRPLTARPAEIKHLSNDGGMLVTGQGQANAFGAAMELALNHPGGACEEALALIGAEPNLAPIEEMTLELMLQVVERMHYGHAPDGLGVTLEHLKYAGPAIHATFMRGLLAVMRGEPPAYTMRTDTTPLFKKGDASDAQQSYRFLQVLNIVRKIVGTYAASLLSEQAEGFLLECQAGFRKQRGCLDWLWFLRMPAGEALARKATLQVLLVDLRQAFDRIDRVALWKILRHYGVPEQIIKMLRASYTGTNTVIHWGGHKSQPVLTSRGAQQGGPESPVLFNIFFNFVIDAAMKRRGDNCGVELLVLSDGQLHRPADVADELRRGRASSTRLRGLLIADDLTLIVRARVRARRRRRRRRAPAHARLRLRGVRALRPRDQPHEDSAAGDQPARRCAGADADHRRHARPARLLGDLPRLDLQRTRDRRRRDLAPYRPRPCRGPALYGDRFRAARGHDRDQEEGFLARRRRPLLRGRDAALTAKLGLPHVLPAARRGLAPRPGQPDPAPQQREHPRGLRNASILVSSPRPTETCGASRSARLRAVSGSAESKRSLQMMRKSSSV